MPTPVELAADTYIRAWSEPDPSVRARMIEACFAPGGRIVTPHREIHGHDALAQEMRTLLSDPQLLRIRVISAIDARGNLFRFRARVERRDGTSLESFDAGEIDGSGRITTLLTFGGPLGEASDPQP